MYNVLHIVICSLAYKLLQTILYTPFINIHVPLAAGRDISAIPTDSMTRDVLRLFYDDVTVCVENVFTDSV